MQETYFLKHVPILSQETFFLKTKAWLCKCFIKEQYALAYYIFRKVDRWNKNAKMTTPPNDNDNYSNFTWHNQKGQNHKHNLQVHGEPCTGGERRGPFTPRLWQVVIQFPFMWLCLIPTSTSMRKSSGTIWRFPLCCLVIHAY